MQSYTGSGDLARLQRGILLGLAVMTAGWLLLMWPYAPGLALAGSLLLSFGFAPMLALEFALMQRVHRLDRVPRASIRELLSAWVHECGQVIRVFMWRQPFAPNAVPDQISDPKLRGQRGVVFVHGLVCNRGFWTPWLRRLQHGPHAFVAVNLEPVFGGISDYTSSIDSAVEAVRRASGMPPLLVCHSMGGLAVRAWLAGLTQDKSQNQPPAEPRVWGVVTLGTPHRGTWLARFGQTRNAAQMREGSDWLAKLNASAHAEAPFFICWYSNCDPIVFPATTATLPWADNRQVPKAAHMQLAFMPQVMDQTLALLQTPPQPTTS